METLRKILNYSISFGENGELSIQTILFTMVVLFIVSILLRFVRYGLTRNLPKEGRGQFFTIFSYVKYFVFLLVLLVVLANNGVNLTALLTGAAALLLGIGLALQTLFQDILSGLFIIFDQSLRVDDIIEIEGKVGRVTKINLRTTRAVTIENKILIIPNLLYLTNTLYNWTQNEKITREFVNVGVAYGSDVQLVKKLLIKAAMNVDGILKTPEPTVFFEDFGDSSLNFRLVISVDDSLTAIEPKSDLRFEIDRLFRENNVTIPFPQRDVHLYQKT